MSVPTIDVIVAVHNPARPIHRAAASVLLHNKAEVRLTVVCHNTAASEIAVRLGALASDNRIRLIELADNIGSPAGPFNAGLDAATGDYVSVLGSDDQLAPGALDSWLRKARQDNASVVIPRLRHSSGRIVPTPPTRPFRTSGLEGVKDRLSYRSAPLGLIRRQSFPALRFTPNVVSGEDVAFSAALWYSGQLISFDRRGPAYVINDDATDRTSFVARPIAETLSFLPILLGSQDFVRLPSSAKAALGTKLIRVNLFGEAFYRSRGNSWTLKERVAFANAAAMLLQAAPLAEAPLSIADRRLLDAILDTSQPDEVLSSLAHVRRKFARPSSLLTWHVRAMFSREAPMRMIPASVLTSL